MKILVVSDTHGNETYLKKAVLRHADMDAMIHLGDFEYSLSNIRQLAAQNTRLGTSLPLYVVTGNCDSTRGKGLTSEQTIELAGHRLFLTHGHRYQVSYGDLSLLAYKAEENRCDIACFGHIHQPVVKILPGRQPGDEDMLIINPGSISRPRQEGWQPSYMILELEEGKEPKVSLEYISA